MAIPFGIGRSRLLIAIALLFALIAYSGRPAAAQGAPAAHNACAPALPDWLLPSEEDYSALRHATGEKAIYDRLHSIPLGGKNGNSSLAIGGQLRQWYEVFSVPPFGNGLPDNNGYLLQRYMIHFDLHAGDHVRFFTDFKGNLENGRIGGPRPDIDEDRGDLHQAFVELTLPHTGTGKMSIRVGRQEMVYGSGRFVDMREGPNVRRAFEGVRITYCSAPWRVDGFASRPVLNKPGAFDDIADHQSEFWGLYATHLFDTEHNLGVDLYYFGFDQKRSTYVRATAREQRHTLGGRVFGGKGGWEHDYEAAGQFGRFGNGGIRAWALSSDTGYRFRNANWKPRIGTKVDLASGDSGKPGSPLATWNPLFASLHYFGEEGLAGPVNFYDLRPEFELYPAKSLRVSMDSDWFWRQSTKDGIYLPGPVLLVAPNDSSRRYIGNKSGIEIAWEPSPHWVVTTYYSHFQNGGYLHEQAKADDLNYAAGWVTYHF